MLIIKDIEKNSMPGRSMKKLPSAVLVWNWAEGDFVTVIGGNGAGKSTFQLCGGSIWR